MRHCGGHTRRHSCLGPIRSGPCDSERPSGSLGAVTSSTRTRREASEFSAPAHTFLLPIPPTLPPIPTTLPPISSTEFVPAVPLPPRARHPHRMRTRRTHPSPRQPRVSSTAIFVEAFRPHISRTRRHTDHRIPGRRRSEPHHHRAARGTPAKKRPGDQKSCCQKLPFHIQQPPTELNAPYQSTVAHLNVI